ncbi:MAG: hypothetical protein ACRYFR_06190 [Janthinobacterium lividum]
MTAQQQLVYDAIDEILWNEWDPIGVNGIAPRDEYQSCTPSIFQLKISGAGVDAIAERLRCLEIEIIGTDSSLAYCKQIAEKIVDL